MFSSIILEDTSEESLREEESRDPEHSWGTTIYPFLQEEYSIVKILDP
jgi:hypothetical protein